MKQNKVMKDLQRLLETQDFKNEDEVNEFLKKYQTEGIPEFPDEALNNSEKAEDKIYKAYELSKAKGKKLAEEALILDPNCILAYQYLGEQQTNLNKARAYYRKGIEIGKSKFGGEFEEENKGHFWMIFETRPYMSCIFNLSECEYMEGNINEAIKLIEYMLELNPNDNQGARYILSSHLLEAKEYEKYKIHSELNSDDGGIFFKFNNALFEFINSPESKSAVTLLKEAIKHNKFVIPRLETNSQMRSNSYSLGSEDEANYYCEYNVMLWRNIEGAIEWAKKSAR